MAKAEAAERALRLLSSSRQDETTMPLLKEKRENSAGRETEHWHVMNTVLSFKKDVFTVIKNLHRVVLQWLQGYCPIGGNRELKQGQLSVSCSSCCDGVQSTTSVSPPSSSSAHPGAVWENMHIVAKVQGFLPPTHTSHWLPLHPAPWEANTLGMNWLPTGWMLPLYAAQRGLAGCGCFYLFVFFIKTLFGY